MGALVGCSVLLAAAFGAADEEARPDAAFETVGIYTELGSRTDLIPMLKASGYTAYEALDGGFARRPDLHDDYYAGVARGLEAAREAGLDGYVILLTNMAQCNGPEAYREATAFSPKDAALVAERMAYLRATVRRLRAHADGFIVFAGDPGGDPERATTVEDFIAFAEGVRDIVMEEAPDAQFIVNPWAVAAWDGFPSPFTTEFWDKEVRLTREVMAREALVAPGVGVEFPMHNYYRSLALTAYADEGRAPELYPTAADVAALKARGVRDIWGWPYFLLDECDDGYSGRTWGHAQAETRYLHKVVQAGRALGLTGMVGNISIDGMDVEALNLYAFGRFCNDAEATPATVLREFAAALAEEGSVADLVQVIAFVENRSSWEAGLPDRDRLPPLPCTLESPEEALATLQGVAPLAEAGLPLRETPEAYLKRLAGRLRSLAEADRPEVDG